MMWVLLTVTASTMIARFENEGKVGCHTDAVEKDGVGDCPLISANLNTSGLPLIRE
jgi:hypothetical protein